MAANWHIGIGAVFFAGVLLSSAAVMAEKKPPKIKPPPPPPPPRTIESLTSGRFSPLARICGVGSDILTVSLNPFCINPVGLGHIINQSGDSTRVFALVRDLNGNLLCISGPVSNLSQKENIWQPDDLETVAILRDACVQKFGLVWPLPSVVLSVSY